MRLCEVNAGETLKADGGFTCVVANQDVIIEADAKGELFFKCADGRHYLDGQVGDDDRLIGLRRQCDMVAAAA